MDKIRLGILVVALAGCATTGHHAVPGDEAIPHFNADSLTTTPTGQRGYAIVGRVTDSVSGKGIQGASVLARLAKVGNPSGAYTNDAGGFAIGHLEPGHYRLLVRRIGYQAFNSHSEGVRGRIDTLRIRMQVDGAVISDSFPEDTSDRIDKPCLTETTGARTALDDYRWTDTTTEPSQIKWRENLGLSVVPVDQITLVTEEAVCDHARDAFNGVFKGEPNYKPMKNVWIVRYGTRRFIVGNRRGSRAGEWREEVIFDSAFRKMGIAGR